MKRFSYSRVALVWAVVLLLGLTALMAACQMGGVEGITNFDHLVASDVTIVDDLIVGDSVQFGDADLNPLGYDTGGEQLVTGTDAITGTLEVDHGLDTVIWALCTLGQDPDTDAGDAAACSVTVANDTVTVNVWQDDFAAATETDVTVHWLAVGTP